MKHEEFVPASGDRWRERNDDNHKPRKRKHSSGVSVASFHTNLSEVAEKSRCLKQIKQSVQKGRELIRTSDNINDYKSLKEMFQAYKENTYYEEFGLQADAFRAFDDLQQQFEKKKLAAINDGPLMWSMYPRVFAVEKSAGKRRYIVCHEGRFMHHYWRSCEPHARHHYEVIKERTPCRLYFDLEYSVEANPTIDDDANKSLMNEFISELIQEIENTFCIIINKNDIVDLDSTTPRKFSRHLIVHMPGGELFQDAIACGVFVKSFVSRLADELATGQLQSRCPTLSKYLFVNSKPPPVPQIIENDMDDKSANRADTSLQAHSNYSSKTSQINSDSMAIQKRTCFVDTGVYTRNRLFRLFGSSKYDKPTSAALRIAAGNKFPFPDGFENEKFYVPAMEERNSLQISATSNESRSKHALDDNNQTEEESDKCFLWDDHAMALELTFVTPSIKPQNDASMSILNVESLDPNVAFTSKANAYGDRQSRTQDSQNLLRRTSSSYINNIGPSPYPALDKFISTNLANRRGANGAIRAWTVEPSFSSDNNIPMIIYQMKGNRWCEHIQRFHKSNNVMWNVSLSEMAYWQTCHDPECRMARFRGKIHMLPDEVQCATKQVLAERECDSAEVEAATTSLGLPRTRAIQNNINTASNLCDMNDSDFDKALNEALGTNPHLFP